MAINQDKVRAECEVQPGYDGCTAYNRTKICCRILTQHGEAIPSWMVVREMIGKGSSGDINRGIKDFRQEHAERLRQMDGIVPGIPAHLAPLVSGFWEAAVAAARSEFATSTQHWQEQIEQAEARADQAALRIAETEAVIDRQRGQIDAYDVKIAALDYQVRTERAGREQAERMFEAHTAEMGAQRDKLEAALKENKTEMEGALARFDGERRYAMTQIEEARTKAARDVSAAHDQAKRETSALEMNIARLTSASMELRPKIAAAEERNADLKQEITVLRAQLVHAEAIASKLTDENRRLATALQGRGKKKPATSLHIATKLRGGRVKEKLKR